MIELLSILQFIQISGYLLDYWVWWWQYSLIPTQLFWYLTLTWSKWNQYQTLLKIWLEIPVAVLSSSVRCWESPLWYKNLSMYLSQNISKQNATIKFLSKELISLDMAWNSFVKSFVICSQKAESGSLKILGDQLRRNPNMTISSRKEIVPNVLKGKVYAGVTIISALFSI